MNAYELIKNASKVSVTANQMYDKTRGEVVIRVQESKDQPVMLNPTLRVEVKADSRQVEIETEDERVNVPLSQFWQSMTSLAVLNRVRKGTQARLDALKTQMQTVDALYREELTEQLKKKVEDVGGEWNLPSEWEEDMIPIGDPVIVVRPTTLYVSNGRLFVNCEDDMEETYQPLVETLDSVAIEKLMELMERPIEE